MTSYDKTSADRIKKIVMIIQRVYLAFVIVVGIDTLLQIGGQSSSQEMLQGLLTVLVHGSIYFGLRRRRAWVIPIVLFSSAFSCLWHLLAVLEPAEDIKVLIGKSLSVLLFLFFAYQIAFFRKSEVRMIFGTKGHVIF